MSMIEAVCFDMDGTLGEYGADFLAFTALLRSELMLNMCDMNRFTELLGSEFRRDGALTVEHTLAGVLKRLQQRPPPDLPELAATAVASYAADYRPLPGAAALLERLDSAGVKLALLTNGPEDLQRAALRNMGLEKHFRVVLISGDRDVAARKPAPRIFGLACSGLQTVPERTLMVGDDAVADVAGALDYGLEAVLIGSEDAGAAAGAPAVADLIALDAYLADHYGL